MNRHQQAWQRLTAAARQTPAESDVAAPYGFSTRLAAQGLAAQPLPTAAALLEKFALRGFVAAAACSLAAVAFGYTSFTAEQELDSTAGDTVTELLAQS